MNIIITWCTFERLPNHAIDHGQATDRRKNWYDCRMCPMCLNKPKYGGPRKKKKKCCIKRNCQQLTRCHSTSSAHDLPDSASTIPPDITKFLKTLRTHSTKLGTFSGLCIMVTSVCMCKQIICLHVWCLAGLNLYQRPQSA